MVIAATELKNNLGKYLEISENEDKDFKYTTINRG